MKLDSMADEVVDDVLLDWLQVMQNNSVPLNVNPHRPCAAATRSPQTTSASAEEEAPRKPMGPKYALRQGPRQWTSRSMDNGDVTKR